MTERASAEHPHGRKGTLRLPALRRAHGEARDQRPEGYATEAYRAAGLAHTLEYELPSPLVLLRRWGLTTRIGRPPAGAHALWQQNTIVLPPASERNAREHGLIGLHEGAHYLLRRAQHTHADVIQLTLCLAVPWPAVRAAARAGALTETALSLRQRHVPLWALAWRIEVVSCFFNEIEVA